MRSARLWRPIAAAFADHAVIVAEAGERLVGCVQATQQGEDLYLGRFAVRPEFRRHGITSRLLAEAERNAGVTALTLGVRITLPDNYRFFAAHGFREVGREAASGLRPPDLDQNGEAAIEFTAPTAASMLRDSPEAAVVLADTRRTHYTGGVMKA